MASGPGLEKLAMTTILMVSGSWPPQVCGVGDYSEMLSRALEKRGASVLRYASDGFSRVYSRKIIGEIDTFDCDLIHIQYPTAGYGRSVTPSVLARTVRHKPVVVTLHEYALFRWYRRLWFSPFAHRCAARIFTMDNEQNLFQRRFPARRGLDLTIEIASNIPASAPTRRQSGRVCYFGLIWPGKGVEDFLDLCLAARANAADLTFELIGAVPEHHQRYADEILRRASACGVHISLGLPDEGVADRLANASFAYLPFPDGASVKRGTLAAAVVNGLIVVTRHSSITPEWIRWTTLEADTADDALDVILRLQNSSHFRSEMKTRVGQAATRFHWDTIARRHLDLYQRLLGACSDGEHDDAAATLAREANDQSRLAS
jgi:glycosyltransferase involved in cell wall biosynthesis